MKREYRWFYPKGRKGEHGYIVVPPPLGWLLTRPRAVWYAIRRRCIAFRAWRCKRLLTKGSGLLVRVEITDEMVERAYAVIFPAFAASLCGPDTEMVRSAVSDLARGALEEALLVSSLAREASC